MLQFIWELSNSSYQEFIWKFRQNSVWILLPIISRLNQNLKLTLGNLDLDFGSLLKIPPSWQKKWWDVKIISSCLDSEIYLKMTPGCLKLAISN